MKLFITCFLASSFLFGCSSQNNIRENRANEIVVGDKDSNIGSFYWVGKRDDGSIYASLTWYFNEIPYSGRKALCSGDDYLTTLEMSKNLTTGEKTYTTRNDLENCDSGLVIYSIENNIVHYSLDLKIPTKKSPPSPHYDMDAGPKIIELINNGVYDIIRDNDFCLENSCNPKFTFIINN